jgi:hypothetical protein
MTTSPLYPYINCNGLYYSTRSASISISDGRLTADFNSRYYLRLFLKRAQSSGTKSGSSDVPSRPGLMPGYSGQSFIYRGYIIQYGVIPEGSTITLMDSSNELTFNDITSRPEWLTSGGRMEILFGDISEVINCKIEIIGGTYGSRGIDEIITEEISGIPITLVGGNYTTQ